MQLGLSLSICNTVLQGGMSPITILGPSLLAWWTADRADLITLNGSAVTSWKDVKHGYDAVQGVSGARPVYSPTSFGGASGLTFDGVDDELTLASQPFPSGALPSEVWSVASQDALAADTTQRRLFGYGGNAATNRRIITRAVVSAVNRVVIASGNGATEDSVAATGFDYSGRRLIRAQWSGTLNSISGDGAAATTVASVPATGTTRARIGANTADTPVGFWRGQVRDLIVAGPLTAEQAAALQAWALPRRML